MRTQGIVNKANLLKGLQEAMSPNSKATHVILSISIDGAEPELQIITKSNFASKTLYIDQKYNDYLEMNYANHIIITDFIFTNNLSDTIKAWEPRHAEETYTRGNAAMMLSTNDVIKWLVDAIESYGPNDDRTAVACEFLQQVRRGELDYIEPTSPEVYDHSGRRVDIGPDRDHERPRISSDTMQHSL
ncbi:hypothetical protein D3C71_448770 [compost metagenome]